MAEFDHGVKKIAETTGRQLARVAGVKCCEWGTLESTLQITTELLADRVFLARQGRQQFVVYFEFYTTWDGNAPWDMLAKSGLLSQRQQLPTVCIAVVLRRQGFRTQKGQLWLKAARRSDAATVVPRSLPLATKAGGVVGGGTGLDGLIPLVPSWSAAAGGDYSCGGGD